MVGVDRTMRPVGVHDGAAGRRPGVGSGDDGGMARPVGVYENAVGALFMAELRYWDMGFLLVGERRIDDRPPGAALTRPAGDALRRR
ncbi:hypothetical protein [Dietzia sp. PP-33]|uniref:hypothetical protein n=1 Tax=Dietzia sp. PP-33 TaxID=2957500 RepID=UPI0029C06426|nr:hypothetical protein [Dietzia sp. PP-33]